MRIQTRLILLFCLGSVFLWSDDYMMTVDDCIRKAFDASSGQQRALLESGRAAYARRTWASSCFPAINFRARINRSYPLLGVREISQPNPFAALPDQPETLTTPLNPSVYLDLGLSADWSLRGGMIQEKRVLESDEKLKRLAYERFCLALRTDVKNRYWQIKAMEDRVLLDRRQVDFLSRNTEQSRRRFDRGTMKEEELIQVMAAHEKALIGLTEDKLILDDAMDDFRALLGLESSGAIVLTDELMPLPPPDEKLMATCLRGSNLTVKILDALLEQNNTEKKRTRRLGYVPQISLSAYWNSSVYDPTERESWQPFMDNLTLSAALSVPLSSYLGPSVRRSDALTEFDREDLLLARQEEMRQQEGIQLSLKNRILALWNLLPSHQKRIGYARRTLALKENAMDQGIITLLEYAAAGEDLFKVEGELWEQAAEYRYALVEWEALTGEEACR